VRSDWNYVIERPVLRGFLFGWLIGMLWWIGLVIALDKSWDSKLKAWLYAPLYTVPWAVVGFIVGGFNAHYRGYWIPVTAITGLLIGFVYSLAMNPFDGWLAIIMPVASLGGALGGLVVGVPTRAVWGYFQGWEEGE